MTRFQSPCRGDGLAARVALVCVCLIVASLAAAGSTSGPAGSPRSAPSAESSHPSPAGAVAGLATTNAARPRLLPTAVGTIWAGSIGLLFLCGGARLAGRLRRSGGAHLVLDDVGDRWRALLIGAPPASLSF